MADENDGGATPPETTTTTAAPAKDKPLGEAGEKALDAFKARAREAEREAKALRDKVQEFEDRDKTDLEKAEKRAVAAEAKAEAAEARVLRSEVAAAKKLPPELADRLQGRNRAELEADADKLLGVVQTSPSFDGGAGERANTETDIDSLIRRTAGRR